MVPPRRSLPSIPGPALPGSARPCPAPFFRSRPRSAQPTPPLSSRSRPSAGSPAKLSVKGKDTSGIFPGYLRDTSGIPQGSLRVTAGFSQRYLRGTPGAPLVARAVAAASGLISPLAWALQPGRAVGQRGVVVPVSCLSLYSHSPASAFSLGWSAQARAVAMRSPGTRVRSSVRFAGHSAEGWVALGVVWSILADAPGPGRALP